MKYLVVVDTTPDNKIAKMQEYDTKGEADAHVSRVVDSYPNAFVIDAPAKYNISHTTVDMDAKTVSYDSTGHDAYRADKIWKNDMRYSDSNMPRFLEDLITSNASLVIPTEMKKRYDAKIKIRGEKP